MTNPITEPTQSIRERLAQALWDYDENANAASDVYDGRYRPEPWGSQPEHYQAESYAKVDAILSELMEPSEGMVDAGAPMHPTKADDDRAIEVWRAMIQHIRDGGK